LNKGTSAAETRQIQWLVPRHGAIRYLDANTLVGDVVLADGESAEGSDWWRAEHGRPGISVIIG